MPSTITDRLNGLTTSVAVKAPCRVATTGPITLSGLQTIDGVTLADRDRVLVRSQANPADNGIYAASAGSWRRTADFDGTLDAVGGTLIHSSEGAYFANSQWRISGNGPIGIGTGTINFDVIATNNASILDDGLWNAFSPLIDDGDWG